MCCYQFLFFKMDSDQSVCSLLNLYLCIDTWKKMTQMVTPQAGMQPNIWSHSCVHTGPVSLQVDHQPTVLSDGLTYFHHTGPDLIFF